jgi:hypothetical protein
MKKIFTLFVAVMAVMSLSAENYFLKSTWGESETATWKQMIDDDGSFVFAGDVFFDGKDIAINTKADDEGARIIKVENINSTLNYEAAPLAAGDSVFFVYVPDMYNAYDEKESGLMAMINFKKGAVIKVKGEWKEMLADDGSFVLFNEFFDGKDVAFATGKEIRNIKVANIHSMLNFEDAPIAAGDSVLFAYDPEEYSAYDETKSGLSAIINFKKGAAIRYQGEWKEMTVDPEDDDWFTFEKALFDGENVQIANGHEISSIKPENISAYINYEDAVLTKGDSVFFIFRPSMVNHYNEKESGLFAHITKKVGYALRGTWGEKVASWKNMILDAEQEDETYVLDNVLFDGKDVSIVSEEGIRTIKVENIIALMKEDYTEAVLEEGDLVMFVYTPDTYSHYDETQSGLAALIIKKKEATGVDNINVDTKAVKVMVNGQMLIIKNGKTYNVNGMLVK